MYTCKVITELIVTSLQGQPLVRVQSTDIEETYREHSPAQITSTRERLIHFTEQEAEQEA
jgi:hypothetical protein